MPDQERSPKGRGPAVGQTRRRLLQTGLGLAATALALDVMAVSKPATSAIQAATTFSNSGQRNTTDAHIVAKDVTQNTAQSAPVHPTETHVQAAVRFDEALAQQGDPVPQLGGFSPQDALQWLEQHWQGVLTVAIPIGAAATIVKLVRDRVTANKAMESSFQRALTLSAAPDGESQAGAARELLYILSNPRSEKYHQRIFAMAVEHFRQRNVANVDQRETSADFKFVPVLVFASEAIRERLQRKRVNVEAARKEYLDASSIHLDGLSLREADLSYLILERATFTGAVLGFASFSHADLAGADLRNTTLNNTDLSHANLTGAKLSGARAREADLRHAVLRNVDLANADLAYAHVEDAELGNDASVAGANIYRATGLTGEMRKKYLEMGAIERD